MYNEEQSGRGCFSVLFKEQALLAVVLPQWNNNSSLSLAPEWASFSLPVGQFCAFEVRVRRHEQTVHRKIYHDIA